MEKETDKRFVQSEKLTYISKNNLDKISGDRTPQEIIAFLESGAVYRSFHDVLKKVYPKEDLRQVLTERLTEMTGKKRDSVARNVRNWLRGLDANIPQRAYLFQICFALALSEEQANQLIASASDTGIHYRNPKELVYVYCLRNRLTWQDAQRLLAQAKPFLTMTRTPAVEADKAAVVFTKQIRNVFDEQVHSEADLMEFLESYQDVFGRLHKTAYTDFKEMLEIIRNPEGTFDDSEYTYWRAVKKNGKSKDRLTAAEKKELEQAERILQAHDAGLEKYKLEKVVDDFFQMRVPKNTSRAAAGVSKKAAGQSRDYTYMQSVVKAFWPSEDILYKMLQQEVDVSRKVLLLLHLLTEEFEVSDPEALPNEEQNADLFSYDDYLDQLEEAETADDRMEIRINRINLFLNRYGMNRLDPGSPFDCLVLYALRASLEEDQDTMSERMKSALAILFQKEGAGAEGNSAE